MDLKYGDVFKKALSSTQTAHFAYFKTVIYVFLYTYSIYLFLDLSISVLYLYVYLKRSSQNIGRHRDRVLKDHHIRIHHGHLSLLTQQQQQELPPEPETHPLFQGELASIFGVEDLAHKTAACLPHFPCSYYITTILALLDWCQEVFKGNRPRNWNAPVSKAETSANSTQTNENKSSCSNIHFKILKKYCFLGPKWIQMVHLGSSSRIFHPATSIPHHPWKQQLGARPLGSPVPRAWRFRPKNAALDRHQCLSHVFFNLENGCRCFIFKKCMFCFVVAVWGRFQVLMSHVSICPPELLLNNGTMVVVAHWGG